MERELQFSRRIVYPITRLLIVAIDMRKPTYAPSDHSLQILTMFVQNFEVFLGEDRASVRGSNGSTELDASIRVHWVHPRRRPDCWAAHLAM